MKLPLGLICRKIDALVHVHPFVGKEFNPGNLPRCMLEVMDFPDVTILDELLPFPGEQLPKINSVLR